MGSSCSNGGAKYKWLAEFLELPKGIPSHGTFRRVFGAIDATKFEECFINWIRSAIEVTQGQVIAVDGKQLRRSHATHDNKSAIHLVSAWACHQGVALGKIKVADKSNEIPAIPQLLEVLEVSGDIVTVKRVDSECDRDPLMRWAVKPTSFKPLWIQMPITFSR